MSPRRLLLGLLAVLLVATGVVVATHDGGSASPFRADGCQRGYVRLSDEYVRELREGTGAPAGDGREAEAEAEREGRAQTGRGFCLKAGLRRPEPFNDLMRANASAFSRLGMDRPGQYARAARQKARIAAAGSTIAGTAGSWKPVGDGHVTFDDPAYTNTNGLASGLSKGTGRISDYAYDEAGDRLFAALPGGGVWMSRDRGTSWTSIADNLPTQIVGAVAWTPAGGGTLIALTGDNAFGGTSFPGQGSFWTTDLGRTWHKATGIPDGAQGFRVQVQQDAPDTVYAATGVGLYRSTDAGRTWKDVVLPTGDCAGKSLTRKGCFLANIVTDVQVRSADAFGHRGGAVAAAVGWRAGQRKSPDGTVQAPANGMYVSSDGAPGSFSKVPDGAGFPATNRVGRVSLGSAYGPKQDHNYLYAVVQDAELFNSGRIEGLDVPQVTDPVLGLDLTATPTYLNGVYVSADFGRTWKLMARGEQFLLPTNNSTLAALAVLGYGPGIQSWYNSWIQPDPYAQSAGGVPTRLDLGLEELFESRTVGSPQNGLTDFTAVAPYANTGAATAGCILALTSQLCQALTPISGSTVHPDQHAGIFLPGTGGSRLVVGNDGGAYGQAVPASGNLTAAGFGKGDVTGFNTLLPYSAAIAKDGTVYSGLQDNGTVKIDPKTGKTIEVYGGDGTYALVDPDDSNQALMAPAGGDLAVTHDGGKTNELVVPDSARDKQFLTPFAFDAASTKRIIYAARNIFIADSAIKDLTADKFNAVYDLGTAKRPGVTEATATADDPSNVATAVALRDRVAYVGYCGSCDPVKENRRFKSGIATNAGGTWHIAAAKGLAQRLIAALAVDPGDSRTVYAALGSSSLRPWAPGQALGDDGVDPAGGHLYKSTDGGETFTDISGNLPDTGASAILIKGRQLIVGTTVGVFASATTAGKTFGVLGGDLPAAPVVSLQLDPANAGRMIASSYGRGVYAYTFKDPAGGCADRAAPVSALSAASRRGGSRVRTLRGTSRDRGCFSRKRGRVKRVTVSVQRIAGTRCRAVRATGTLAAPARCSARRYLRAAGFRRPASSGRWSLTFRRPLPAGRYVVRVRAVDAAGNTEKARPRGNVVTIRAR